MKQHFLTVLRNKETTKKDFCTVANQLATLVAQEVAAHVHLEACTVQTPFSTAQGFTFTQKIILVPILRSGLAMLPAFLSLFPESTVGFLGIKRNENTAAPHTYYENLPNISSSSHVVVLDPMIATGGTAHLALTRLAEKGAYPPHTMLVSFLAAKEGLHSIMKKHPEVKISVVGIDPELNKHKFIIPGLGDFGERYFGI